MARRLPSSLVLAAVLLAAAAAGCATSKGAVSAADKAAIKRADDDAESLFSRGRTLREEGRWSEARKAFTAVYEDYPSSPLAGEAQFQAAECAHGDGRFYAAGHAFARYIEDRPLSPHVDVVEKRMYEIGDFLIEDGRRGLWGTGIFSSEEDGVEILRRLASLLATGSYADDALMRLGRYFAGERQWAEAEAPLDQLLRDYPASEWRLEARFLLAWTYRKDNRGPEYDGEKLRRARAHFLAFVAAASSDADRSAEYAERLAAARAEVEAIDADLARKYLARARLYRRMDRPAAALFVLQEAARQWGTTEPGQDAARQAEAMAPAGGGNRE